MAQENKSKVSILTNGIIKENPVLRLVLGTCSILAVTTAVSSALGMGAAFTFVLVCSNIMISLLRKVIPGKVHLPCYIVIIAGFVTIVQMFMQAYMESLYNALGVFLPLIVVNCIILGRAEMFACKNNVVDSALDGVGMGLGYTLTATLMASIREILGSGTWLGFQIIPESVAKVSIMTQAPGAFFCFGLLMAGCVWLEGKLDARIERKSCCDLDSICPFLGVSKKLDSAVGMSGAVIFVMFMATAVTFPIQIFILDKAGLSYLQTIVFILVIAVLVQFIEIFLKKYIVALYNSLGVYLPLITTNCCVLAVTILVVGDYGADVAAHGFGYAYIEALICAIGAGCGFMLAMVMFSGVRKRVEACDPPAPFKGLPITLIAAAITSLSFMGFGGIVENLFNVTL